MSLSRGSSDSDGRTLRAEVRAIYFLSLALSVGPNMPRSAAVFSR
jgi:hypothetical protein